MKFNYEKHFNDDASISVKITVDGITYEEADALEVVGAPQVVFSKYYPVSKTMVEHDLPLNEFVGVATKFKSKTYDVMSVAAEVDHYIADIKEFLRELVEDLMESYKNGEHEDDDDKPEDPEDKPDKPEGGCQCGCDCLNGLNIRIVETIPDDLKDGEVFGLLLEDEEDD